MIFFRSIIRFNSIFSRKSKRYILVFLNGFLLASLVYLYTEKSYEQNLFGSLAAYVRNSVQTANSISSVDFEDSLLTKSVHLVHELGYMRQEVFQKFPVGGIKAKCLQPVSFDFMTNQGACGSYAYVLGRLLQELNIEVRFPQMTVQDRNAGHIINEAKTSKGWVVLDAAFDLYFRKPDGQLAAFKDVSQNWIYYKNQLPSNYNIAYRYEGVRYTNWGKVPLIMPLVKRALHLFIGKERTDTYSLRSLMLKKYNILFNITLCLYLLIITYSLKLAFGKEYLPDVTRAKKILRKDDMALSAHPLA
jgi:hypothetical protein